ncbi:aminopeptidase [Thermodesulfatator autotrophicus]|uniref:M18 family aminopeptidase n=1 Tax=Thermodesulfatator autotrophicus TaxID=1795632 RepID=A0A177E977_9BACT|nr:aminopeptidase [Thermodesulfatator autotrophicus]OAG27559.1 aminopeptidase [Thermodesulfatator autotrophicus]
MAEKTELKELKEKLAYNSPHVWDKLEDDEKKAIETISADYKDFLNAAKTERECAAEIVKLLEKRGFSPASSTRWYHVFRDKVVVAVVAGRKPVTEGVRLIASHIDCPRLDLKLHPLLEEFEMAFLKTHYYGGIKKYHWVAMPLALHGVVIKADGEKVQIKIGEDPNDPVFTICDLLPHLARKAQGDKKLSEAIPGEKLNVLFGGLPLPDSDEKERVKLGVLKLLNERYGLVEEDFISAELEVVPAGEARDVGLDRAFIGAYGHDDRSSAFASLAAILNLEAPLYTSVALFLDKEEIGSDGNTGAKSRLLEKIYYDLLKLQGLSPGADIVLETLFKTKAISADVTAGIDPFYIEVHEKQNDAKIGHGVVVTKYTGHGGKYAANDAHAEYVGWFRRVLNKARVVWQAASFGKVDEGGGGTVAKYLAYHGMDIIDCGPPLLSMHSPFEIIHKGDLYMTFRAYKAFYEAGEDES